jgi:hypothetical protein
MCLLAFLQIEQAPTCAGLPDTVTDQAQSCAPAQADRVNARSWTT